MGACWIYLSNVHKSAGRCRDAECWPAFAVGDDSVCIIVFTNIVADRKWFFYFPADVVIFREMSLRTCRV